MELVGGGSVINVTYPVYLLVCGGVLRINRQGRLVVQIAEFGQSKFTNLNRPNGRWFNGPPVRSNFGPSKITVVDRNFGSSKTMAVDCSFGPSKITIVDRIFRHFDNWFLVVVCFPLN